MDHTKTIEAHDVRIPRSTKQWACKHPATITRSFTYFWEKTCVICWELLDTKDVS